MKFTCTQENLFKGVSQTAPIAGRNSQLPILQYILIKAEKNSLTLTTTDLEIGVRTIVGGKILEDGSCALPAKSFLEYVSGLPKTHPITIEKKGGRVFISTKGFQAQFASLDADEYPLLPSNGNAVSVTIPSSVLCGAISRAIFSAAREETRPEIRSVFLSWQDGVLSVAATDSFRLAEYTTPVSSPDTFSLLLPLPSAQEIIRLFHEGGDVSIVVHDNYVSMEGDGVEVTSRVVEGQYPNYRDIIPSQYSATISIDREEFMRALKTLSVFLPRDSRRVSLTIRPEKGEMIARVAGGEMGQGEVALDIEGNGEEMEVLMNIQYLIDGVSHVVGDVCELFFAGPVDPVVFREKGGGHSYMYVVMPIQA